MKHEVLGEISHKEFWQKEFTLDLYSRVEKGKLEISGEHDEEIEALQIKAYTLFIENMVEIIQNTRKKLYEYYLSVYEKYRDKYGEDAYNYAPIVNEEIKMKELLTFQSVYIPYQFDANELEVGILFDSKWENELGVAAKIINGKVSEIGYQDIIL